MLLNAQERTHNKLPKCHKTYFRPLRLPSISVSIGCLTQIHQWSLIMIYEASIFFVLSYNFSPNLRICSELLEEPKGTICNSLFLYRKLFHLMPALFEKRSETIGCVIPRFLSQIISASVSFGHL